MSTSSLHDYQAKQLINLHRMTKLPHFGRSIHYLSLRLQQTIYQEGPLPLALVHIQARLVLPRYIGLDFRYSSACATDIAPVYYHVA